MSSPRDYTSYSFLLAIIVIAGMLGLSQLPKFKIANLSFKKVNILSDIIRQQESPELLEADKYFDTTFLNEAAAMKVIDSATRSAARDTLALPEAKLQEWNIETDTPASAPILLTNPAAAEEAVVPVESFGDGAMSQFNRALSQGAPDRPVRIAVLGDSFIEGDIITADLREQLQSLCGGSGVGFVPFASPLAKFRGTVRHSFDKWNIYNIRDRAQLPSATRSQFFVSGLVCTPQEGATTRLKGVTFRKHINQASTARLIFTNRGNTLINVVVNDSVSRLFAPEPSEHVQQIVINAPIHSISVTLTQTQGFTGYGIVLEDPAGISVDNYSIRGNSGMALFETNSSVNSQIGRMVGYDLIVLQYGLNVMSPDVLKYDSYAKTFTRIINYVRQCFPDASILVMSVGDRSTMRDGQFVTMPAVRGMIEAQRQAAQSAGVAFWNTFDAMGGENSMVNFVQKKWAAQDHTHIRYPGGKYIAQRFAAALVQGARKQPSTGGKELPFYHGGALPVTAPKTSPSAASGSSALVPMNGWERTGKAAVPQSAKASASQTAKAAAVSAVQGQTAAPAVNNAAAAASGTTAAKDTSAETREDTSLAKPAAGAPPAGASPSDAGNSGKTTSAAKAARSSGTEKAKASGSAPTAASAPALQTPKTPNDTPR